MASSRGRSCVESFRSTGGGCRFGMVLWTIAEWVPKTVLSTEFRNNDSKTKH